MRTLLYNAGPIAHMSGGAWNEHEEQVFPTGMAIMIVDGRIDNIQDSSEVEMEFDINRDSSGTTSGIKLHDLGGKAVVPGLIDAHTHLLWGGDRSNELSLKRKGLSYREIAARGGGIQATVRATRAASDDELYRVGFMRLRNALRNGTTHLEAKSGYGLSTESELRLLAIMDSLNGRPDAPSIDPTWMGAHDIPSGVIQREYVEELIADQLPAVCEQGIARSADVFCEEGWFSVDDAETILQASRDAGLALRMHIDEFVDGGGGDLASSLKVVTADHAYCTPIDQRMRMMDANVMTGFLPGTPYSMGMPWPDMAEINEHKIPYTFATDFNPNCQTLSLPFVCSLMVQRCNVDPLDALRAVTVNAASTTPHPSGRRHGVVEAGGVANLNIVDSPYWEAMMMRPGSTPFCATVLDGEFIPH